MPIEANPFEYFRGRVRASRRGFFSVQAPYQTFVAYPATAVYLSKEDRVTNDAPIANVRYLNVDLIQPGVKPEFVIRGINPPPAHIEGLLDRYTLTAEGVTHIATIGENYVHTALGIMVPSVNYAGFTTFPLGGDRSRGFSSLAVADPIEQRYYAEVLADRVKTALTQASQAKSA